jgi:hypothetical protein
LIHLEKLKQQYNRAVFDFLTPVSKFIVKKSKKLSQQTKQKIDQTKSRLKRIKSNQFFPKRSEAKCRVNGVNSAGTCSEQRNEVPSEDLLRTAKRTVSFFRKINLCGLCGKNFLFGNFNNLVNIELESLFLSIFVSFPE